MDLVKNTKIAFATVGTMVFAVIDSFFDSNMDVVSPDAKKIKANKEDRQKYIQAVEKVKSGKSEKETIILASGDSITIS